MKNRLYAFLGLAALCLAMSPSAHAQAKPAFEIGYSSAMPIGVRCTTGTVVQINLTRPTGFNAIVAGYRVQNQDDTDPVWIGGVSVSTYSATAAALGALGEKLTAGADGTYPLGRDYNNGTATRIPLYCRAADAAGVSGAILSVYWFGY